MDVILAFGAIRAFFDRPVQSPSAIHPSAIGGELRPFLRLADRARLSRIGLASLSIVGSPVTSRAAVFDPCHQIGASVPSGPVLSVS